MSKPSLASFLSAIVLAGLVFSGLALADDRSEIADTINRLTKGIDEQDGDRLRSAFRDDASIFATNPAGDDLVSLTAEAFAQLHADGRFGGQQRRVSIDNVDITEGLIAQAKVIAQNDEVHYTYYLGFVKLEGEWKILNFLQRSRPAETE